MATIRTQALRRPGVALCLAILLSISAIFSSASAEERVYSTDGHFSFVPGAAWKEIPREVVNRQFDRLRKRAGASIQAPSFAYAFQHAESEKYFQYPYFFLRYKVIDTDTGSPERFLADLDTNLRATPKEKGLEGAITAVELRSSKYDPALHMVTYEVQAQVARPDGPALILQHSVAFFGRDRVAEFDFYSDGPMGPKLRAEIDAVAASAGFSRGYARLDSSSPAAVVDITRAALLGALLSIWYSWRRKRAQRAIRFAKAAASPPALGAGTAARSSARYSAESPRENGARADSKRRTFRCTKCDRSISDVDAAWDRLVRDARCPRCNAPATLS